MTTTALPRKGDTIRCETASTHPREFTVTLDRDAEEFGDGRLRIFRTYGREACRAVLIHDCRHTYPVVVRLVEFVQHATTDTDATTEESCFNAEDHDRAVENYARMIREHF